MVCFRCDIQHTSVFTANSRYDKNKANDFRREQFSCRYAIYSVASYKQTKSYSVDHVDIGNSIIVVGKQKPRPQKRRAFKVF